jgi:hypothetical protein
MFLKRNEMIVAARSAHFKRPRLSLILLSLGWISSRKAGSRLPVSNFIT